MISVAHMVWVLMTPDEAHPAVGQLLDHADVGEQVEAQPAVGLRDGDAEQPELAHLCDDRLGVAVLVLHLGGHRDDLLGDEPPHRVDDLVAHVVVGRGRGGGGGGSVGHGRERYSTQQIDSTTENENTVSRWPATLMHHAARAGRGAVRRARAALRPDEQAWTFGDLDERSNAFARLLAGAGRRPRRPGGGDDRPTGSSSSSRCTASAKLGAAAVLLSPAWKAARGRPRARRSPHRSTPSPTATAVALLGELLGADRVTDLDDRRRTGDGRRRRPTDDRRRRRRRSDRRRGGAGVQLRHHRAAQGGAPHPPLDGPRHRGTGCQALGLGPDDRFQVATPPSHILGLLNLLAAAEAGATRAPAPPLRPRRGAAPHRDRPDDARDGGGADRAGHGQPPRPRGLRPLVAALHHVGRHPGHRERGRAASPSAPACGGCRPTAPASCRCIACNPVDRPDAWRLDSAGLPPDGVELRVVDLDTGEVLPAGRDRRDPGAQPVGHGRLPARRGRPPTPSPTAGTAPATSAGSSPRAGCTSPTAPRR